MNDYLPWVIMLALLAWTGAPLLRRAFRRFRSWLAQQSALDTPRELAPKDTPADEHEAQANAAAQKVELERRAAEAASLHAAQQEAERSQAEHARQQAEQAERVAAREAEEQARQQAALQQEAERAEAARLLALQDEQARQDQAAADEQARRDEAERQLAELAMEQARRTAEEVAPLEVQAGDQATPTPPPETSTQPRTPAQTMVLVVDDSKVVRVKTSRLLTKHGYRVTLAEDGSDAARQMAHTPPHVLITDVEMPGMDGFELSRHLRGLPHMAHIPIIMITSAEEKYAPQAAQVGVNVLLGKPYRDEDLIAQVESSLTGRIEACAKLVLR